MKEVFYKIKESDSDPMTSEAFILFKELAVEINGEEGLEQLMLKIESFEATRDELDHKFLSRQDVSLLFSI